MPHKRSHAAQSADLPVTQAQIRTTQPPSPLYSPSLTPPFPHIPPTLTHIKIPEADRLRDFLLYQAQCDPHHSGGSDERSRGKGLFAQAQACQLSQEQRTQDCGGNGVSTAAGEYRIGAEPHARRQDQPGQTGLDALERCPHCRIAQQTAERRRYQQDQHKGGQHHAQGSCQGAGLILAPGRPASAAPT